MATVWISNEKLLWAKAHRLQIEFGRCHIPQTLSHFHSANTLSTRMLSQTISEWWTKICQWKAFRGSISNREVKRNFAPNLTWQLRLKILGGIWNHDLRRDWHFYENYTSCQSKLCSTNSNSTRSYPNFSFSKSWSVSRVLLSYAILQPKRDSRREQRE